MNPEDRYPDGWSEISAHVKAKYHHRCSRCWKSKEVKLETHHTIYRISGVVKPGKWATGIYLFPLCQDCHPYVHKQRYWKRGGSWQAHNTRPVIWGLRIRYFLGTILRPVLLLIGR